MPSRLTIASIVFGLIAGAVVFPVLARPVRDVRSGDERDVDPICAATTRLLDVAEARPMGRERPSEHLAWLIPEVVGKEFAFANEQRIPDAETIGRQRDPAWLAELRADGFHRGFIRTWRVRGGATASVHVYQFETREGALSFQRFALASRSCSSSHDVFEVEGVPGAIGMQIRSTDGTGSEQVAFVRGSRRYLANVRGPTVPARTLLMQLTHRLSDTAR